MHKPFRKWIGYLHIYRKWMIALIFDMYYKLVSKYGRGCYSY